MSPRRVEDYEWIAEWYSTLLDLGSELHEPGSAAFEAGAWSLNKLAYVGAYAKEIFEPVGGSNFDRLYYVDLLAGNGLTSFEDTAGDVRPVAGSAIAIPALVPSFHRCIVNDGTPENVATLEERIDKLRQGLALPGYSYYSGDANAMAMQAKREIFGDGIQGALTLTFVDNQGLDVGYKAIGTLSSFYNDIFILYPTMPVWRLIEKYRDSPASAQSLRHFFGDDSWVEATDEHDARRIYVERILEASDRHDRMTGPAPEIKGPRGHRYHVVCSVRRTPGGSGFLQGLKRISERVDGMKWSELLSHVDVHTQRQASLDFYQDTDGS